MPLPTDKEFENKPLTEYRLKVQRTKWFLRRFYSPEWLQRPTKTNLIVSLIAWAIAITLVFFNRPTYQAEERGYFLTDLMAITATITVIGRCIFYFKSRKKQNAPGAPNR